MSAKQPTPNPDNHRKPLVLPPPPPPKKRPDPTPSPPLPLNVVQEFPKLWASFRDCLVDLRRVEHMRIERLNEKCSTVHIVMYSGQHFTSTMPHADAEKFLKQTEGIAIQ